MTAIIIPTKSSRPLSSRIVGAATRATSADMIRCRLLYKLGIYDSNYMNASIYHKKVRSEGRKKQQQQQQQQQRLRNQGKVKDEMMPFANSVDEPRQKVNRPQAHREHYKPQEALVEAEETKQEASSVVSALSIVDSSQDSTSSVTSEQPSTSYLVPLKFEFDQEDTSSQDGCNPSFCIIAPPFRMSSSNKIPSMVPSVSSSDSDGSGSDSSNFEPPVVSILRESSRSKQSQSQQRLSIEFDPSVTVIPIPSHRDYTTQEHAQLHISKEELAYSTVRNTREFVYEGWNWRNVIEEDKMFLCRSTGDYVHPAHLGYTGKPANPYL